MPTVLITHGFGLIMLSIFMLFPMLMEFEGHEKHWKVFALCANITIFFGVSLIITNKRAKYELSIKEAYLLTATIWIVIGIFAALPFYFTRGTYHLSFVDSIFESISGLTTTGSTVYIGIDNMPSGLLLWRSLLEWFGGVGIIVFSMSIFPYLRVGGMQLFKAESSDTSDKILSRVNQVTIVICGIYLILTFFNIIAYYLAGMTGFDALNHALTTISTGGFSTYDASFGHFKTPLLQWICVIFMIAGGTPLFIYYYLFNYKKVNPTLKSQAEAFYKMLVVIIFVLTIWLMATKNYDFEQAIRDSAFNVVSVVTTTGFATTDYTLWGGFAIMLFYFITLSGGCTGSTSGGIKIFRLQVIVSFVSERVKTLLYPHGVFRKEIGKVKVTENITNSVLLFVILFMFTFIVVSMLLALTGLDYTTSLSGAATALANVGPGLGDIIGPSGNFASLPDSAKWILSFAMLLGRLEIITVIVCFMPFFWKD